jgi:hypothetical protein
VYFSQGTECQSCHLPFIQDSVIIASDFQVLKKRHPFGLHQFFGANTAMLDMMKVHKKELSLPSGPSEQAWDQSIENNRISLSRAADLTLTTIQVRDDTLSFMVTVRNKTGHKLPTGYPSRLVWIQITLEDQSTQEILYKNGVLDEEGHIPGRDHPFEPHHQVSKSAEDVQIYEMVMSNVQGHLTTRLNAAFQPLKDNRLLPTGFRTDHTVYDTVAIWGDALTDQDYTTGSISGQDKIEFRIPLGGQDGFAVLDVSLRYQALPPRWMNDLFTGDALEPITLFKSMYQGYETFEEIIAQTRIEDIDLNTTSVTFHPDIKVTTIFPNPVSGTTLNVRFSSQNVTLEKYQYEIMDLSGRKLQNGILQKNIDLQPGIQKGVFYLVLSQNSRLISVKPFTVL